MADNLPEYNPTVVYDVTPPTDTNRAVNAMISGFKEFGNNATNIINKESNQITEDDKSQLQFNVSKTFQDFAARAALEPDKNKALADYQASAKEYSDGLMNVSGNQKQYVQNITSYYGDQHYNNILKDALSQNKRVDTFNNMMKLDQLGNDQIEATSNPNTFAGSSAGEPNANPQFAAEKKQNDDALSAGTISEDEHTQKNNELLTQYGDQEPTQQFAPARAIAGRKIALIQQMVSNREMSVPAAIEAIKTVKSSLILQQLETEHQKANDNGTTDQFFQQILAHHPEGLTTAQTYNLVNTMHKQDAIKAAAYGITAQKVNLDQKANLQNIMDNGAEPNANVRSETLLLNPSKVKQYDQDVEDAQVVHKATQAWLAGDPAIIAQNQKLLAVDPNSPDAPRQRELLNKVNKQIALVSKNYAQDPMKYELQQPYAIHVLNQAKMAADANASGHQLNNSPVNDVIRESDIYTHVMQAQQLKGKTLYGGASHRIKLLTNDEALRNVSFINNPNTSPNDISNFFSTLRSKFADNTQYQLAIKQMGDHGLSPKMQFAATLDPNTPNYSQLINTLKMPTPLLEKGLDPTITKGLRKNITADVYQDSSSTDNFASYRQTLHPVNGVYDEGYLQNLQGTVYALGLHYLQSGEASDADSAKTMAENTFANRYDYKTVAGGGMIAIPKNNQISSDVAQQFINAQSNNIKYVKFGAMGTNINSQLQQKENILAGHFVNTSDENTLMWVGANGKIPPLPDGKPYTIDLGHSMTGNTQLVPQKLTFSVIKNFQKNFKGEGGIALKQLVHPSFHPVVNHYIEKNPTVHNTAMTGTQADIDKYQSFIDANQQKLKGAP